MQAARETVAVSTRPDARATVLVGFAESLAAPEVTWSLLDAGYRVVAYTRRGRRPALRRLSGVQVLEVEAPERDAMRSAVEIAALVDLTGAAALMPLDDAAVWLCDQASLRHGSEVAGPTGRQAEIALDKRLQLMLAEKAGFRVPTTECVARGSTELADIRYPAILKPALAVRLADGGLSRGRLSVWRDREALEADLRRRSGPHLIQPVIEGIGEGLFGLSTGGRVEAWSAHRRLRMMNPKGSGSSACVAIPVDPSLAEAAARLVRSAGWTGMFMIELLRDRGGRSWFMELNGRPWGSMALARRMGMEYPAWAVDDMLGKPQHPFAPQPFEWVTCRHLGRELVHVLAVIRGSHDGSTVWPPRWRTLVQVCRVRRGERWYNWRPGEIGFFVADTYQTVRDQLLHR
jgi:predicted ATP-grasp superfamily ATP-dependent carboligase